MTIRDAGYMSGFGNGFETEALPGALPVGPQLAAEMPLRPLCRAAQRLAVHRAAHHQRALLALSHPPDRGALGPVREGRHRPVAHGAVPRSGHADRADALGPDPDPRRAAVLRRGRAHHHHGRRRRRAGRHGRARLSRHPLDGGRVLLQRRRRDAVRAAAAASCGSGPSSASSTSSPARSPSSRAASRSGSSSATGRPAAISARTTAARSRCPSAGRSAPTAWPTRATS